MRNSSFYLFLRHKLDKPTNQTIQKLGFNAFVGLFVLVGGFYFS